MSNDSKPTFTTEELLEYANELYVGTHSQSDLVHPEDLEKDVAQLECKFKWCWSRYQALRNALIERDELKAKLAVVSKKQVDTWADRLTSEMEIVGYVPTWLVLDILTEAGIPVVDEEGK